MPLLGSVLGVEPVRPLRIRRLREIGAWHDADETLHVATVMFSISTERHRGDIAALTFEIFAKGAVFGHYSIVT